MDFITQSSQIISFIRSNNPQSNRSPWLKWREFVEQIYEFDIDPNQIKLFINQGKGSFRKNIKSVEDVSQLIGGLEQDDKIKTIQLILLYFSLEEKEKEQLNINYQVSVWNTLKESLCISDEDEKTHKKQITDWLETNEDNRFFTPINIKASLLPINLDFALRCILLWAYNTGKLDSFGNDPSEIQGVFYFSNYLIITITIFLFALIRGRLIKIKTAQLFKELKIEKLKLNVQKSAWDYTLIFLYVIIGIFVNLSLKNGDMPLGLAIFSGAFQGLYMLIILNLFSKRTPKSRNVLSQLEIFKNKKLDRDLTHEENDEEIINLEVKLRSINEQMEAFVLEAALFGALAFSGFLSVIASDVFSIASIETFSKNMALLFESFIVFDWSNNATVMNDLLSKEGLLALMCYETLFCSIFFLSVIASRLRFNDLTDFVDRSLQLSRNINEREEEMVKNQEITTGGTLRKLTKRIRQHLRIGNLKYEEIGPIMEYMKFFRKLGISTFFIIIITGGLFISVELSIIMLFISALSLFYFKINDVLWSLKSFNIRMQEFYFSAQKIVSWGSWTCIVIAFILRSFGIPLANIFMVFGFTFLCLHHLFRLFIPEIINTDNRSFDSNIAYLKFIKKIEKIGTAFFFLGFMFKAMHWPGAGVLLVFGLFGLSFYFFLSPKKTGAKWMNVLFSLSLGIWVLAILFKIMHWPGSSVLEWIGIVAIVSAGGITVLKRNEIEKKLKRVLLIFASLTIVMQFDYIGHAITHMNLNYNKYLSTKHFYELRSPLFTTVEDGGYADAVTPEDKDSLAICTKRYSDYLLKEYNNSNDLNSEAWSVNQWLDDEIVLNEALVWVKQSIKLNKNYNNVDTYVNLLIKLKRWKEAESIAIELVGLAIKEGRNAEDAEDLLKLIKNKLGKNTKTTKEANQTNNQ